MNYFYYLCQLILLVWQERINEIIRFVYMKHVICRIVVLLSLLMLPGVALMAQDSGDYYDVFIAVNENVNLTQLREAGMVITARYDDFITARVQTDMRPSDIKQFDGVLYATPAIKLVTYSDSARYYSRVLPVHEGDGFDMPYTGEGVIVGVIDCGFDFNHINLWDANGEPRVKAVYLPMDNTGKQVMINRIPLPGSSFETPERIKDLTTDDPLTTHGTQTAGIAAGSYKENGWYGMAPGADLVLCGMPESELTDVRVAHCISFIDDYAKRVNKPYVVNISLGSNAGTHDGTSFLTRIFRQFSGPGHVFVVSAGNDGDSRVCVHRSITSRQDTVVTLLSGYSSGALRTGYLCATSKEGKAFNTKLIVVDTRTGNIVYRSRAVGATASGVETELSSTTDEQLAQYYTGNVVIKGSIEANENPTALCSINMRSNSANYAMGFQFYSPLTVDMAIWTSQYAYFNNYGFSWAETGSSVGSISDLATTDSVISVGSYNSKQYVTLRDGSQYYRYNSIPMRISYYSSYGPDENGIARPDVCAPGSVVVSSANRYDTDAPNLMYWQPSVFFNDEEYPYCPDLGTSMSAPVVTGAVALWLQADPTLSTADVREVLRNSSYRDGYVNMGAAARWGFGKLDVNAGMRHVLNIDDPVSINGDVNGDAEVNISDINTLINIILGGTVDDLTMKRADVNGDREVSIGDINTLINMILN